MGNKPALGSEAILTSFFHKKPPLVNVRYENNSFDKITTSKLTFGYGWICSFNTLMNLIARAGVIVPF